MSYVDLENQVLTALATQKNEAGEAIALPEIMISIDRKMAELNTTSIGFDTQGIPRSQDIFK
ncbi:MAG: hypothetical protein D6742_01760, partial [Cyanobacteria bacterium J069]